MDEQEELQRIRNIAIERLKNKNLSGPGGLPPINVLEREMDNVRQEEQEATSKVGEDRYDAMMEQDAKNTQLKRMGMLGQMQPDLSNRAYELFPNLKNITGEIPSNLVDQEQKIEEASIDEEMPTEEQSALQKAQQEGIEQKTSEEIQEQPQSEIQQQIQQQMQTQPSKEDDIESLMNQVSEREEKAKMDLAIAKFRDAIIGAGGTGYKSNLSQYEEAVKGAKKPLQDYQTRLQLMEVKEQLADKKAKNDPTSAVSKMLRQSLQDIGVNMAGFENVSFNQLEKIYPSLANAISTKIAADARKIEAVAKREEAAQNKIDKLEQKQKDNLIKHIDFSMKQLSKDFGEYEAGKSQLDSAVDIVEKVRKGEITPGMADVTALYTVVKGLDPNSAVREGEIALSREAMSLWGKLYSGVKSLKGGDLLDSATRKSIQEILKAIQITREKSFGRKKDAVVKAGIGKGLDKQILEDSIYPDVKSIAPKEEIRTKMINGKPVKYKRTAEGWKKV